MYLVYLTRSLSLVLFLLRCYNCTVVFTKYLINVTILYVRDTGGHPLSCQCDILFRVRKFCRGAS